LTPAAGPREEEVVAEEREEEEGVAPMEELRGEGLGAEVATGAGGAVATGSDW
jgi:hypothetical protein